ncbi:MAG: peptidase C15 [Cyanobacteria bacterium P01_E01_bin.6]
MAQTILLTSFTTWKPEQSSNSSDDLLDLVLEHTPRQSLHVLRKVPVHFKHAPSCVIHHIQIIQPDVVICCGMSEKHHTMNLESRAVRAEQIHYTDIDLAPLAEGLRITHISDDAGRYVCNSLYFDILDFLHHYHKRIPCLFVHVPRLSDDNQAAVVQDFLTILHRMESLPVQPASVRAMV